MPDDVTFDGAGAPPGRAGGFTDWLPGMAARRRAVGDAFLDAFAAWGYELLATPLVEPLETVAAGVSPARQAQLFRFMDADGSLLALVGERTVSVARVVATQLRDAPLPQRLCYLGPVLRNAAALGGRRREVLQAGCELIGGGGLAADAECVALAAEALSRAGLDGVQVDVGHADFLPGLLEGAGIDGATRDRVLGALAARDLVAVEEAIAGTPVGEAERALLLRFPALRGGREILDAAASTLHAPRPLRALDELATLWDLVRAHGLETRLHLDLGAVRDWDYYTGPIFEVFTGDIGFPLGSGGRYDSLLSRFGVSAPATGFVLHVDRCCDALNRGATPAACVTVRVSFAPGHERPALAAARRLRRGGCHVTCDLAPEAALPDGSHLHVDGSGAASWRADGAWRAGPLDEAVAQVLATWRGRR